MLLFLLLARALCQTQTNYTVDMGWLPAADLRRACPGEVRRRAISHRACSLTRAGAGSRAARTSRSTSWGVRAACATASTRFQLFSRESETLAATAFAVRVPADTRVTQIHFRWVHYSDDPTTAVDAFSLRGPVRTTDEHRTAHQTLLAHHLPTQLGPFPPNIQLLGASLRIGSRRWAHTVYTNRTQLGLDDFALWGDVVNDPAFGFQFQYRTGSSLHWILLDCIQLRIVGDSSVPQTERRPIQLTETREREAVSVAAGSTAVEEGPASLATADTSPLLVVVLVLVVILIVVNAVFFFVFLRRSQPAQRQSSPTTTDDPISMSAAFGGVVDRPRHGATDTLTEYGRVTMGMGTACNSPADSPARVVDGNHGVGNLAT